MVISLTGCIFGAGPYCTNPAYDLDIDEVSLVHKLKELKTRNPQYEVELTNQEGNKFSPDEYVEPHYYCVGFNLPMGDTIVTVKVLVNVYDPNAKNIDVTSANAKSENKESELLFQAYSFENGRSWRLNEQHIGAKEEQKKVLKTFEKEVLDKLGVKYRKQWLR